MPIGMHPVDGLIYRLLQQNSKPAQVVDKSESLQPQDKMTISTTGEKTQSDSALSAAEGDQRKPGERALESHLLNLYRMNDRYGG